MTALTQVIARPMTLAEFLEWKPEEKRYELRDGVVVEMQPTGQHEEIGGFLILELSLEIRRLGLPYLLPKQALIRPLEKETGYLPDLLILDRNQLSEEPLWQRSSTLTQGGSVPLVIEIVSRNWRDDYGHKLADYEGLGIQEYWIIDHLGLGGRRYIGDPKRPTLSIYDLVGGEYQVEQFRGQEQIQSQIFPELCLTAEQIFQAGKGEI